MSDETSTSSPDHTGPVVHLCCADGCTKWGGLGFARTKGDEMRWWCAEHYPYWSESETMKRSAKPVQAPTGLAH